MTSTLTAYETDQLIRGFWNHQKFCEHLKIRNKEGLTVPYKNSPAGRKLNRAIRNQEALEQPVRVCMLKASQVWASSSVATEVFRRIPFLPGRRALVVADSETHADLVFEYYKQYIESYADNPYGGEQNSAILLPNLVKDTERWIRWSNASSILVGTAGNPDIGRSAPFNWAHLSEAAFYGDMARLMTGLMQRIPNSPDSGIVVESTGFGMGGDFYDLCMRAMDPRKACGWAFVFFGYHEHPEYRKPAPVNFKLTRDELAELQKYNLHIDQLAWRREQIETACEGKIERFRQEFPGNPEEAFQSSGRTIFDMAAVARMPIVQNAPRGRLEVIDTGTEKRIQFIQSEDGRGELVVYKMPRKGGRYAAGMDHAEGIDLKARGSQVDKPGVQKSDPDFCSMTVFDLATGEECAKLKERYEPGPWAERAFLLGKFYNWAFLTPEAKALGKAVIGVLLTATADRPGYPLELIYSKERAPDDRHTPLLQELGFDTNTIFRPVLINGLDMAIRDGSIKLHDPESITQCRQFVRKPNGRAEGIGHDDDVIGIALAVQGFPQAIRAFQYREERTKGADRAWKPEKYGVPAKSDDDDDD